MDTPRLRIAYLVHFYPPSACGGAGYYTAALAEAFQKAGHEVGVLCVDRWGEGDHYLNGLSDGLYNGVPVRRLDVNWQKAPRPFDWLYDSPVLGEQARAYLESFQPDVVHMASCYTLSARPVLTAKQLGLPVVMHLHDYWTICPRVTLLRKDDVVCPGPESAWSCQRCLLAGTKAWQMTRWFGDAVQRMLYAALARSPFWCRQRGLRGMLGDLERRQRFLSDVTTAVDALLTPSAFARDLLEAHGHTPGRIVVMPNGNRVEWRADVHRVPSDKLRIGFLGNVTPIKGVHVLTEAYRRLAGTETTLEIWGNTSLAPAYYEALRASSSPDIFWGGHYDRRDLPRILSRLDVIVVPSIWYETQGIVIQEAFAAGLPVIASNKSSLTESVIHGRNGLHFERGSVDDLVHQIRRLLEEPGLLEQLRLGIAPVRTIDQDVAELGAIYANLGARRINDR